MDNLVPAYLDRHLIATVTAFNIGAHVGAGECAESRSLTATLTGDSLFGHVLCTSPYCLDIF